MSSSDDPQRHTHFHQHAPDGMHTHDHVDGPDELTRHAHSHRTDGGEAIDPMPVHYSQLVARVGLLDDLETGRAMVFRKTARIVGVRINRPFTVETDRGVMTADTGDWLVTNHPDDDPGSDVWSISNDRMESTYNVVPAEAEDPWMQFRRQLVAQLAVGRRLNENERSEVGRQRNLALTVIEEAILRIDASLDAATLLG